MFVININKTHKSIVPAVLNKISQISIHLKGRAEKISEVVLLQPISKKAAFDTTTAPLAKRTWTFLNSLTLYQRFFLKIQLFFLKRFQRDLDAENQFKTVVAILLSQEELRMFFLGDKTLKKAFFVALQSGAEKAGYKKFTAPKESDDPRALAKELTSINGGASLLDDYVQLNLKMSLLEDSKRDEILCAILSALDRPPLQSVLEVTTDQGIDCHIEMATHYAQFLVSEIKEDGLICFRTRLNSSRACCANDARTFNQHIVYEEENVIGSYCGQLLHVSNALEQLLFLLNADPKHSHFWLEKSLEPTKQFEVLFTSLFSWNEYDKILKEHNAIKKLHNTVLRIVKDDGSSEEIQLKLYHQNLSFNAFNKFPGPSEIKAHIRDFNAEMLIDFTKKTFALLNIDHPFFKLEPPYLADYLEAQKALLKRIDQFEAQRREFIDILNALPSEVAISLKALLSIKHLSGIDAYIFTTILARHLNILHNTNCHHATDRSGSASAIDKAQSAFIKMQGHAFLPGVSSKEERSLFEVFYSMYLVWEEPEINAGLSTGFIGEKFFKNFIQKNPETTKYLTPWLKKHPQLYLALSKYRK